MRLVVLTGTSSGLGKCIAKRLHEEPGLLICVGRRQMDVFPESDEKKFYLLDLADAENDYFRFSVGDTFSLRKILDISEVCFINNAAQLEPVGEFIYSSDIALRRSVAVNITAPMLITKELVRMGMPLRIINISSGAAIKPISGWASYCASKSAARMFFDVLALEDNVSVTHIDPGIMDTPMQEKLGLHKKEDLIDPDIVAEKIVREL